VIKSCDKIAGVTSVLDSVQLAQFTNVIQFFDAVGCITGSVPGT